MTAVVPQTITFPALPSVKVGDADFAPGATASSGLAVSYTSSNTSVATIVNGNIRIVGAGTTTITASQAGNDQYEAAANVTQTLTVTAAVTPPANVPLISMFLPQTTLALQVNRGARLEPIFRPINASNKLTTWSTNNPDVATVSSHGVVTGIAEGTAVITVITDDGGYVATCKVTVTRESPVGNEEIENTPTTVYPNPVTDVLYIQSMLPVNKATIYALNGSVVLERTNIENTIDVSALAKGIYFLKLTTAKGEEVHKIIKK